MRRWSDARFWIETAKVANDENEQYRMWFSPKNDEEQLPI